MPFHNRNDLLHEARRLTDTLNTILEQAGPPLLSANHPSHPVDVRERDENLTRQILGLIERRNLVVSQQSKLPPDVLTHIFILGQDSAPDLGTPRRFAMLVSHVCRRWRTIALGASELWAFVDIHNITSTSGSLRNMQKDEPFHPAMSSRTSAKPDNSWQLNNLFLQRARSADLATSISLNATTQTSTFMTSAPYGIIKRMRELQLSIDGAFDPTHSSFLDLVFPSSQTLRRLCLTCHSPSSHRDAYDLAIRRLLQMELPLLRQAQLSYIRLPMEFHDSLILLRTCTTIKFRGVPIKEVLTTLLRCCPAVKYLELVYESRIRNPPTDTERLLLPELQELEIYCQEEPWPLALMNAPNLHYLQVASEKALRSYYPQWRQSGYLEDFLASSGAVLRTFCSSASGINKETLIRILQQTPSLRRISLNYNRNVLEELGIPYLWPELQSLTIQDAMAASSLNVIADFLEKRRSNHGSLTPPIMRLELPSGWEKMSPTMEGSASAREDLLAAERRLAEEAELLIIGQWKYDRTRNAWAAFESKPPSHGESSIIDVSTFL